MLQNKGESARATVRRSNLTETALCIYETAPMLRAIESGYVTDTSFVSDTGASSHMVNLTKYLTDITPVTSEKSIGNDDRFQCTEKGIYRGFFKNKHGMDVPIVIHIVLNVPWLAVNLLSITKRITKQGVPFSANNRNLF
jgi:hypothetical protein